MKRTYIYRLLTLKGKEWMDMELEIKLFYFLLFSLRIFSFIIIAASSRREDNENSLEQRFLAVKAVMKLFRAKL